ncbi:MAG: hypothetical protein ABSH49_15745 [Bryobacteraceae bacterium]
MTKLLPNDDVYFSIPGDNRHDRSCPTGPTYQAPTGNDGVLNVAAIAISRINGRSLLAGNDGRPLKQAPLESMLQVPRETPKYVPTQRELIRAIREKNDLLQSTIINNQLQDCLARGTWACTFNDDTNINVVISQR